MTDINTVLQDGQNVNKANLANVIIELASRDGFVQYDNFSDVANNYFTPIEGK
jgi:hypothetical protein